MTNETKPPSQLVRQKKRRRGNTAGRRIRPETDAPQSLTADELHEIERKFARLPDLEPIGRMRTRLCALSAKCAGCERN